jgi:two-component system sensor histidine kinase PhcS
MSELPTTAKIESAFVAKDRMDIIQRVQVGCLLGILLMPAGAILDFFVYREEKLYFLGLRLLCSLLIGVFWAVVVTRWGHDHPRKLGVLLAMFPSLAITWMIYVKDGSESLYYAGLNLVLLVIGFVLYWSALESLVAVSLVLIMYIAACVLHGHISQIDFVNNLYFLGLTGIIVVTGSYFHSKFRLREFALRFELDEEKKKTDQRNQELADTIKKLSEAESQLVQSEKMASLGRMSAGIIHEINNPLNFATTGLFTLRKKSKHVAADQLADYEDTLKDVEDGITRVKNIVSDLRMFTHPSSDEQDEVEASEVVASAMRFLSNELKEKVNIEQKLIEHQTVRANKNKLIHVFVNLIQNSLDALRNKPFNNGERPTIWIEGRVEQGSSYLIVRDNGPGIDQGHLDKIFDPFFTTKEVGEGMGLGLSICYRIMQESRGRISVRTEVGKFCEFTLEFPVHS